jgi:hypothetical protein
MELVLRSTLYQFDWKRPNGMLPSELDMTEEMGITARRKHDLYLQPVVSVPPHYHMLVMTIFFLKYHIYWYPITTTLPFKQKMINIHF